MKKHSGKNPPLRYGLIPPLKVYITLTVPFTQISVRFPNRTIGVNLGVFHGIL